MKTLNRQTAPQDDIQSILKHSGVFSAHLDRLEQMSTSMHELEWMMMKRGAKPTSTGATASVASRD